MVKDLLSFGRRPQGDEETLDINHVIREMGGLLRRMMPGDILLRRELGEVYGVRIARRAT